MARRRHSDDEIRKGDSNGRAKREMAMTTARGSGKGKATGG